MEHTQKIDYSSNHYSILIVSVTTVILILSTCMKLTVISYILPKDRSKKQNDCVLPLNVSMLCLFYRFEKTVNKLMFLDQIAGYLEFLLQVYRNYSFHLFDIDPHNEIYCFAMVRKSLLIHEEVLFLSRHPIYFV